MNKSDSERVATTLDRMGMQEVDAPENADLVLYNSCSIRKSAEDRIFGRLKLLAPIKEKNPKLIVGVTGCLPGRDRDGKIRKKMPLLDLYFPIKDLPQLPRWIAELNPELANSEDFGDDYLKIKPRYAHEAQTYVSVQTGCNKFCTYCVVPYSRGLEGYRPAKDILEEIRDRAAHGTVEVTLLGQTINNYQASDAEVFSPSNPYTDHFAALLWEVNQIGGLERVHFTAPHPVHMTDEVIDALTLPKHVNYLHLPVQAGNDAVLKSMNRRYTAEDYLALIRKIRAKKPDIALGTDIIVGFCGETAEQFEDTVKLYKEADFDVSYTAIYSTRSGTVAHKFMKDDVPHTEKKRRWLVLEEYMTQNTLRKNKKFEGKEVEVLVEDWEHNVASGQSSEMKLVRFNTTEDLCGKIVKVRVTKAMEWMMSGELVAIVTTQKEPALAVPESCCGSGCAGYGCRK